MVCRDRYPDSAPVTRLWSNGKISRCQREYPGSTPGSRSRLMTKVCSTCRLKLDLDAFAYNKSKKDGRSHNCKKCHRKYCGQHYKRNKSMYAKRNALKRLKLRKVIWNYLDERSCVDCGEINTIVLEFDHKRDKRYNISQMTSRVSSVSTLMNEILKCDVVCANCHRKRTAISQGYYKFGG